MELTNDELFLIAAALHAVSPCGGGSSEYTLARKVTDRLNTLVKTDMLQRRITFNVNTVIDDAVEAGAVTRA